MLALEAEPWHVGLRHPSGAQSCSLWKLSHGTRDCCAHRGPNHTHRGGRAMALGIAAPIGGPTMLAVEAELWWRSPIRGPAVLTNGGAAPIRSPVKPQLS